MNIQKLGPLRTRSRVYPTTFVQQPLSRQYNYPGGTLIGTFGSQPNIAVYSGSESISYTVSHPSNRHGTNWCKHLKSLTTYSGNVQTFNEVFTPVNGPNVRYEWYGLHRLSEVAHSTAITTAKASFGIPVGSAVLGSGGQAYINDAAWRLRPDLTTVSIPNFLYEIGEIRKLFELWKKNLGVAKNLAGLHLNYKFGWKPTLGDLSALVEAIRNLMDKVAAFEKSLDILFSRECVLLNDTVTKSGSFLQSGSSYDYCDWNAFVSRKVTAHIKWRPQPLAAMANFEKVLRVLLDSLGFELNPRILWDATPFTFVIDWFFGVGSWLERFKIDTLELPIVYVDSSLHYKETTWIESDCRFDVNSTQNKPSTRSAGWVTTEKYFYRLPIFPDYTTLSGLGWRNPTRNQWRLLVSLGAVLA